MDCVDDVSNYNVKSNPTKHVECFAIAKCEAIV